MKSIISFLIEALMWLAGLGLCVLVSAYMLALHGNTDLADSIAAVLFPGIFVVWFPTILITGIATRGGRRNDFWKLALRCCPQWMRNCLYAAFGLGALNLVGLFALGGNRKNIPMIYFGAGHMLIFYSTAFCTLYSAHKNPNLMENRKCPNQHVVSPTDQFCPTCGAALVGETSC